MFYGSTVFHVSIVESFDRFIEAGEARHVNPLEEGIGHPRLLSLKARLQGQREWLR